MLFELFGLLAERINVAICHVCGARDHLSVPSYNPIRCLRLLLQIARQREHVLCDLLLRRVIILDSLVHIATGQGIRLCSAIIGATSPSQRITICG